MPKILVRSWITILVLGLASFAQDNSLLAPQQAGELFDRALQLMESTTLTVPGLARASEPLLENCRQSRTNLQASRFRDAGETYTLLGNLRAYLALADAMPKPLPFPEEARRQFAELRSGIERLDSHFRALLGDLQASLRQPDRDNLKRYAEDNLKAGNRQPGRQRVVFLGDSITDGWRLNEYFPESDFLNRGISGQITGQMLGRLKADVLDLKPDAVVILAGTNDIARGVPDAAIQNNLTMIAELAKLHGIKVILASILPVHDYNKDRNPQYERTPLRPPGRILDLNRWIRDYCRRERHTYLDYFTALVDGNGALTKDFADDGLHPNAAGYRVMAPLAWKAITQALGTGARLR